MTKLKVTNLQTVEVEKKDLVEAGQVRMAKESDAQNGVVVLIVDAREAVAEGTEEQPYVAVILESTNKSLNNKIEQIYHPDSPERIRELFPILLDAELTYKEAK